MNLSSEVVNLVRELNRKPTLINEATKSTFIPTSYWPILSQSIKKPFVVYVCRPGLDKVEFHIDSSQDLALGRLHFLFAATLHVGYIFEIDYADHVEYNRHYIMATKKKVDWNRNIKPEVALTNQYLTVYSYGEEFVMAATKQLLLPINKPA
jgi:hypothetical protein